MAVRFFGLLLLLAGFARADSITIGQIQFLGTENGVSAFKVSLDSTGVSAGPLTFADLLLSVQGSSEDTGPIITPVTFLFLGGSGFGLPACPCDSVTLKLVLSSSNQPVTLTLADGRVFTAKAANISTLGSGVGGQLQLQPGDSAAIVLTSIPEPATLTLIAIGLPLVTKRVLSAKRKTPQQSPAIPVK
jgi:hypothetical protein